MINNGLIFDVGMHKGEDTEFYLKKGFNVVAIEANPQLCAFVEDRLHGYADAGRLNILNNAIARKPGQVAFYVNDRKSDWGTIDKEWADRNERLGFPSRQIVVNATRFSDVLKAYGIPYYLKIDIEGADMICLEELGLFAARPRFISLESSKTSFDELFNEFAVLWTLGYRKFKIVPQHKIQKQRCPCPSKEGEYIDHEFEPTSSGLFGDELPGKWLGIEEALRAYRRIFREYQLVGDSSMVRRCLNNHWSVRWALNRVAGWYDTHAMQCGSA
jgi:FkbM family methyltransferase